MVNMDKRYLCWSACYNWSNGVEKIIELKLSNWILNNQLNQ